MRSTQGLAIVLLALVTGCGSKTGLSLEGVRAPGVDRDAGAARIVRRTLSMSWSHACAIVDGEVWCWGDNSLLLVAHGAPTPAPPTRVRGPANIVEVATGQLVSCALAADGTVWCWGVVVNGDSDAATPITALPRAERLYVGSGTVCVLTAARTVSCTGFAVPFSAGVCVGPGASPSFDAASRVDLTDVVDLALGQRHACAVRSDASVWCWGCNDGGELGRFDVAGSSEPRVVEGVSATHIAAETGATCATAASGRVMCWGEGSQFGTSVTILAVAPRAVSFGVTPGDLDVGVISTCAGTGDRVGCQGSLIFGDCSDRRAANRFVDIAEVREVSIGYQDMCARDAGGTVWCWGCNSSGALGDGTTSAHAEPRAVRF